jgi:hypothetical protein
LIRQSLRLLALSCNKGGLVRQTCLFIILLLMIAVSCVSQEPQRVSVPSGTLPVLDGTLAAHEWVDALSIPLNAESDLFLKHVGGYLFLAVRATTMGVPSPLIVQGEKILVLHASAALGTAVYTQEEGAWRLQKRFEWQCRISGFSAYAMQERDRFLAAEGWLGTIGYLGSSTEFEYKILLDGSPLRMLFLFMEATDPIQLLSWPAQVDDLDPYLEIIAGPLPDEVSFDLDRWATLTPVQKE